MSGASTVSAFRPSTEPLIFLGMACMKVGLSTIYQLNYDYFADLNGFDVGNKTDTYGCNPDEMSKSQRQTQTDTNEWGKYTQLIYTVSALSAFVLSAMSDRYGRKNILLICLSGQLAFYLIHLLQFSLAWPIYYQLLANFINGVTGGAYILLSVSFAAIADLTKNDSNLRGIRISIAELSIGLGSALVAFLNGYLLKWTDGDLQMSLIFVTVLQLLAILYCLFLVNDDFQNKNFSVYKGIIRKYIYSFHTYTKHRPNRGTILLWLLVLTYVFNSARDIGQGSVLTLYEKNSPFCWTKDKVSFAQSLQEITFVVGILLGIVFTRTGWLASDTIVVVGIAFNIVSSGLYGMSGLDFPESSTNSALLLAAITSPAILAPAITPLLRAKWVEFCQNDEHGAIFGLPAVLSTLAIGISTFTYQSLYSYIFGNVFFAISVSLDVISLCCFLIALIGIQRWQKSEKM